MKFVSGSVFILSCLLLLACCCLLLLAACCLLKYIALFVGPTMGCKTSTQRPRSVNTSPAVYLMLDTVKQGTVFGHLDDVQDLCRQSVIITVAQLAHHHSKVMR